MRASAAERCEGQRARIALGRVDDLRQCPERYFLGVDDQDERHPEQAAHECEVVFGIIRQRAAVAGIDGVGIGNDSQRLPVRPGDLDGARTDQCGSARLVLDDEALGQAPAKVVRQDPGDRIDTAPCRIRHDERHRSRGPVLSSGRTGDHCGKHRKQECKVLHWVSS